jgi:hypothetical protein
MMAYEPIKVYIPRHTTYETRFVGREDDADDASSSQHVLDRIIIKESRNPAPEQKSLIEQFLE